MANVLETGFSYTYPGLLTQEVIVKPAIQAPELQSLFRFMVGIKSTKQLSIVDPLGKITKAAQACGSTKEITGDGVIISNRTLETVGLEVYLKQCYDAFYDTILQEGLRTGIDEANLSGTQLGNLINGLISDAVRRDMFRLGTLGDTGSSDPYYSPMDGLWPSMFAGVLDYSVKRVGSAITALNQTAGTRALDYLRSLWEGAPLILRQIPPARRVFAVTENVFNNLLQTYQDKTLDGGGLLLLTEAGSQSLSFNGVPVVPFPSWDADIEADSLGNNVRILYTTLENHVINIDASGDGTKYKIWVDDDTDDYKIRLKYKLGYQYILSDLQAISYGNI